VGWVFFVLGLSSASGRFAEEYAKYALFVAPGVLPGAVTMAWVSSWIGFFGFGSFPLVFLLFPNGRLLSRRWRPVAWLLLGVLTLGLVTNALKPGPLPDYPGVTNPFGMAPAGGVRKLLEGAADPVFSVTAIASIISAILRF